MTEQLREKPLKKERPLPKAITRAILGLCDGTYRNITQAAEAEGYTRSHLSKALRKPQAQAFIEQRTREILSASRMPAAATLVRLLEVAQSERVKTDIAFGLLAISNHRPPPNGTPVIQIGMNVGYIVDWSGGDRHSDPVTIDIKPGGPHDDGSCFAYSGYRLREALRCKHFHTPSGCDCLAGQRMGNTPYPFSAMLSRGRPQNAPAPPQRLAAIEAGMRTRTLPAAFLRASSD